METTFTPIAWKEPRPKVSYVPTYVEGPERCSLGDVDKGSEEAFSTISVAMMMHTQLQEAESVDILQIWGFQINHKGKSILVRNHMITDWMLDNAIVSMKSDTGEALLHCSGNLRGHIYPKFYLVPSKSTEYFNVPLDPPFYIEGKEYRAIAANVPLPVLVLADPDYGPLGPL